MVTLFRVKDAALAPGNKYAASNAQLVQKYGHLWVYDPDDAHTSWQAFGPRSHKLNPVGGRLRSLATGVYKYWSLAEVEEENNNA